MFREDESCVLAGDATENLPHVSRIALNLLKSEEFKGRIHSNRLRVGWDDDWV